MLSHIDVIAEIIKKTSTLLDYHITCCELTTKIKYFCITPDEQILIKF